METQTVIYIVIFAVLLIFLLVMIFKSRQRPEKAANKPFQRTPRTQTGEKAERPLQTGEPKNKPKESLSVMEKAEDSTGRIVSKEEIDKIKEERGGVLNPPTAEDDPAADGGQTVLLFPGKSNLTLDETFEIKDPRIIPEDPDQGKAFHLARVIVRQMISNNLNLVRDCLSAQDFDKLRPKALEALQIYREKVLETIDEERPYFREALVNVLFQGDPERASELVRMLDNENGQAHGILPEDTE